MLPLAQMPLPQLPPLPEGPSLENVRGPIEASGFSSLQITLAVLAIILIGGGLLWLLFRSKRKKAPELDLHGVARAELDAAKSAVDDERFAQLCSGSVRRLIQSRYQIPATAQTTEELSSQLSISGKYKESIVEFLNQCDGVKFAREPLNETQRIQLSDTAQKLIEIHGRKEPPSR